MKWRKFIISTSFSWAASRASKAYAPIKQYSTTNEINDTWEKTHLKNFHRKRRKRRNLIHLEGFSASTINSNVSGRECGIVLSASKIFSLKYPHHHDFSLSSFEFFSLTIEFQSITIFARFINYRFTFQLKERDYGLFYNKQYHYDSEIFSNIVFDIVFVYICKLIRKIIVIVK